MSEKPLCLHISSIHLHCSDAVSEPEWRLSSRIHAKNLSRLWPIAAEMTFLLMKLLDSLYLFIYFTCFAFLIVLLYKLEIILVCDFDLDKDINVCKNLRFSGGILILWLSLLNTFLPKLLSAFCPVRSQLACRSWRVFSGSPLWY